MKNNFFADDKKIKILAFIFLIFFLSLIGNISAVDENKKNVYFFWGIGCPHCENVIDSGVLEEVSAIEDVKVYSLEVYVNQSNRDKYMEFTDKLGISQNKRGIPFLVIECGKNYSYLSGDVSIIKNLKNNIINCNLNNQTDFGGISSDNPNADKITLGGIVIAALIDSINPCAFGVLIFLLATIFSTASSKRALKYGLTYIFIIFLVYFSAGLGIIKFLSEFSGIVNYFVVVAGILVFIGGIMEIKDFFWYGRGISLKIPVSVKPALKRMTQKGTLSAVIVLGVVVALVELPCTGGIYLAILSLMSINKTFGIPYLLLYNFIFVLPLIAIVLVTHYGTKTEKIQIIVENNKKWMRLAAGIVMIGLAFYLFNSAGWI